MTDWDMSLARVGLFANVLPRAVLSAHAARRGDAEQGRPPSTTGLRTLGETAVDEFFIAINSVIRDIPELPVIEDHVRRCAQVADEFGGLGVLGANPAPGFPTIESRSRRIFGTVGYRSVGFRTEVTMPDSVARHDPFADQPASMRVMASGRSGRRWLIWVHGAAQGRPDDLYAFRAAHLHRELGYDLALPVLPAHGPRHVAGVSYPGFDPLLNVLITIRAVAEIRSIVSWVASHEPAEITIAGTSLGGPIAALVASLDPRITSVLAVVPMLDMHATLAHHMGRAGSIGRTLAQLMRDDAVRAVSTTIDPLAVQPFPAVDRRMVIAALNDRVTSVGAAQRLHRHWGGRVHWYRGSHVGHALATNVRKVTDGFLD